MSAIPFEEHHEGDWEPGDDTTLTLGGRRRRQYFTRTSAALLAVITAAIGFYIGIRIEKGQVSSSSGTATPSFAGLASRTSTGGAASRTGSASGLPSRSGSAGGFPSGAGGFSLPGGSSNATIGTIQSVGGNAVYVSGTSGNTVKVVLNSSTKMTKSLGVSKRSLHPGDSVVIGGLKNSNGSLTATSVTDSGSSGTSTTGTSTTGSSSSAGSSGSSGVGALFSGSGG
jgi:hypothetical protein